MKQCPECLSWFPESENRCPDCRVKLIKNEYSNEAAEDGIFEDERQKEAEENF
jgi:predicted amidophosphoribosyltransferase